MAIRKQYRKGGGNTKRQEPNSPTAQQHSRKAQQTNSPAEEHYDQNRGNSRKRGYPSSGSPPAVPPRWGDAGRGRQVGKADARGRKDYQTISYPPTAKTNKFPTEGS